MNWGFHPRRDKIIGEAGYCSLSEQSSPSFPPRLFTGRTSYLRLVSCEEEEQNDFKEEKLKRKWRARRTNKSNGHCCESESLPHCSLPQTTIPVRHYSSLYSYITTLRVSHDNNITCLSRTGQIRACIWHVARRIQNSLASPIQLSFGCFQCLTILPRRMRNIIGKPAY